MNFICALDFIFPLKCGVCGKIGTPICKDCEKKIEQYKKEGQDSIKNTKIWVCDICGFIYIGEKPPKACPVCKVPNFKILEVE